MSVHQTGNKQSIWYINATSLNNKIDELRAVVEGPDIICVTETWFNDSSDVTITSYHVYRADRKEKEVAYAFTLTTIFLAL